MVREEGVSLNSKNLQELIKNLRIFYKCPSCGAAYRGGDIIFLGRVEEHCFMQLTCHDCSLPILATILTNLQVNAAQTNTVSKPKQRTDLKPREKRLLLDRDHISSSEIAEFYSYLNQSSGDYQALIHKPAK
ncbi:hypothetical protein HYX70_03180 [Candidatus Saccharibacteria bacterium]|nr:hypothetical protein [Candidatus Saccharibacteria bacterium]